MINAFEIRINTTDDPSGVKEATLESIKYTEALGKVAAQEEKISTNRAAKEHFKNLTDEEKATAVAAYRLSQEQAQTNKKIQEAGSVASKSSMGMTELWSSVQQAKQYFQILGSAVDATVGKFVTYAGQVEDLTQLTGANAEEGSRLIKVSENLEISYESLGKALEAAVNKGIDPSVESLAKLSDLYLALQPGLERSKFLMDSFGKSGMDMANMMELGGQKIKQQGIEISSKLIIDEQAIQKAKEYTKAQGDLKDSTDELAISIGQKILPVQLEATKTLILLLELGDRATATIQIQGEKVAKTSTSYTEYNKEMQTMIGYASLQMMKVGNLSAAYAVLQEKNKLLTKEQWELGKATGWATTSIHGEKTAIDSLKDKKVTVTTDFKITGDYHTDYLAEFLASHPDYRPGAYSTGGKASGGPVSEGMSYWVGEEGIPEMFIPNQSGTIVPNNKLNGGGNTNITLAYSPMISLATQAEAENVLLPIIRKALRALT